jgi:hypothetical protein
MSATDLGSFMRALATPTPVPDDDGPALPRSYKYERLARVSLLDTYYNAGGDACPDFVCWPTPSSAVLMQDIGLLFRKERDGFSVLYDTRRRYGLIEFLRGQYSPPPQIEPACCPDPRLRTGEPGVWTHLSFVLALQNPAFLNFTDLPIGLNPSRFNLYFNNREAHRVRGLGLLLNPGPYVQCPTRPREARKPGQSELLRVLDGQYPVPTGVDGARAACVCVVDVRGEVMICRPTCVTRDGREHCTERLYLDFSVLPMGRYQIRWLNAAGEVLGRLDVIYTESYPVPLCFVDLFFTDPSVTPGPSGDEPGLFPVTGLWSDAPQIRGLDYRLRFRRRSVPWNYYVVPQRDLLDLRIEGDGSFEGPTRRVLPNGRPAWLFTSTEPLALEQLSTRRLTLYGRPADATRETALYDPLPLAAPGQVVAERAAHVGLATAARADLYVYV